MSLLVFFLGSLLLFVDQGQATEIEKRTCSYHGLVIGVATEADVLDKLGKPSIDARDDLRYPVAGQPELNDRLYFHRGKLALVTAASADPRFPNKTRIIQQLGKPEARTVFQTQEYLDYSEHGLRFICDGGGKTTGVIYFVPMRRRIPVGYPNVDINLRREKAIITPAEVPKEFHVGAAQVSIAPERFDNLLGEAGEKTDKQLHLAEDMFARAVVFERGETQIVLVGLDVFGMGPWDLDRLRKSLAEKGFPNVILAMSHTHANVDTIGFYGYYPREYARHILAKTEQAVLDAAANLQPLKMLKTGSTEMPLAGGRVVDLIRNGRDPGVVDPTVSILQAIGTDGKSIANVVNLACHPEVIRLEESGGLSPDYVGALCNEVSRELGGQTVFLNGALGGMITPDTRFRTQQTAEEMGKRLARYVVDAAATATPVGSYQLSMHRRPVQYPIAGTNVAKFMKNAPEPFDFYQSRVSTEMNLLWIGDAQYITVPGELLPDIAMEILSHMPGRVRGIIGLANGQLGYLIPSFDFREGEYEERTGPGPAGGEITRSVGLELAPMLLLKKQIANSK